MPDLTGKSIGRYHIVAPLGEGGMATVYKAFDTRLECDVAIKFIRKENIPASQWEHMIVRFEREAKRMAKLMHPNIVKVTDYGEYDSNPYLVMPYLAGGTLKDMLKGRGGKPLPYQEAARLLSPVARALEYAHRLDTIHRDIKPANILITEDGAPLLTDFGVAKILDLDDGNTLTGTGVGVGTPKYMAPEQWMNHISPQTDVYSLGVVYYELITGRVPYLADTPAAVMLKQNTEPIPHPRQFVAGLPEDVDRLIFKALAKDSHERYVDMGALAQSLERLAQGTLTLAPHPQMGDRNETTVDYAPAAKPQLQLDPSSSARSAPSQKSAVQTSSTASMWEVPADAVGSPISASVNRDRPPTPSPYVSKPILSAKSTQSKKPAIKTFLLNGSIGIGLMVVTVVIVLASWFLFRPSKPSSDINAQTVQFSVQETLPPEVPKATAKLAPIVVACWSGPEHDNLVKVAAEYEKKTGNKVTVEEIARESYFDKLTTTFVAKGSDYDVAYVSSDWPPAWIKADALKDLDQFINDPKVVDKNFNVKVYEPAINTFRFDGKTYAFPSEGDTAWMFYRKDLLEAKAIKVPETWDEYLAAAKQLNNPPEMYGAVIGAKPDEALWDFMHYLFSFGGDVLDKDNKPIINNEAGVAALTFYTDLLRKEKVVPPDVNTYGYNEILTNLQEGKVAMGVEWMAATQTLTDCKQSPKVCKDDKPLLGYAFIPGYKAPDGKVVHGTGGSSWGWVIPSGSKNGAAAYKFIEWLTGHEGGKMWALNGGIPSNQEALTDPEVAAKIPQFKMLGEVMPIRHLVPSTTVTSDMVTAINEAVVASVTGTKEPKAAMDECAAKMTEMLQKAGYIK